MIRSLELRKLRMKEVEKLREENQYIFKNIILYISKSNLRLVDREEVLHQILDMLLIAQEKEKDLSYVIGEDHEMFCKAIIHEYENSNGIIYKILNFVQKYVLWTLLLTSITMIINKFSSTKTFSITVNYLITLNIIALIVIPTSLAKSREGIYKAKIIKYFTIESKYLKYFKIGVIIIMLIIAICKYSLGEEFLNRVLHVSDLKLYFIILMLSLVSIEFYKRIKDRQ